MTEEQKRVIVRIQFKSNLSNEELLKKTENDEKKLVQIEGMIVKFYHFNPETKVVGSTYLFENLSLARDYLRYFLIKGIGLKYGIIPDTLKIETAFITKQIQGMNTKHIWENYNSE